MVAIVFDLHHSMDLLDTALGWASNIALIAYAPFAKSWRRALLIQGCIVGAWALVHFVTTQRFGETLDPPSLYALIFGETMAFALATRTLKLLLFKLPILKAFEARLRPPRR